MFQNKPKKNKLEQKKYITVLLKLYQLILY